MKLSDFLCNIGKPVAFYPGLVKALGSMKQAVFICQMAYWKDKGEDPEGWIYKSSEEIEAETSLTYKEQTTVRAALVDRKALEERYARTEHKMYFRVNWDTINSLWEEHLTNGHMPESKVASYQREGGTLPTGSSLKGNTENTQKTTQAMPLSWKLAHGEQITQAELDAAQLKDKAHKQFEAAFKFGTLPWAGTREWEAFSRFVCGVYQQDPHLFEKYVEWRNGDGKFEAMSNKQIRMNPQTFIDVWPAFASARSTTHPEIDRAQVEATRHMLEEKQQVKYVPPPPGVRPKLADLVASKSIKRG